MSAIELSEKLGRLWGASTAYLNLGMIEAKLGDYLHALDFMRRALSILVRIQNKFDIANALIQIADVLHNLRNDREAARLLGAVSTLRKELGIQAPALETVGAGLSSPKEEFEAGARLSWQDAAALVLNGTLHTLS